MKHATLIVAATVVVIVGLLAGGGVSAQGSAGGQDRAGAAGREATQKGGAKNAALGGQRGAAAKSAIEQGPLIIQADVVDADGRAGAGAEIIAEVTYSRGPGDLEVLLERAKGDGNGHARFELARQRPGSSIYFARVWAHQEKWAVAMSNTIVLGGRTPPPVVRLTLDRPSDKTITIVGVDQMPVAGLRVAPVVLRKADGRLAWFTIPDEWIERLTVTTDAKGMATFAGLSASVVPMSIRIGGSQLAQHTLPVEESTGTGYVLKVGRPGRLVGVVRTEAGEPLGDIPVEVWVRGAGSVAGDPARRRITPDEIVRLESGPIKSGPQGTFQTPAALLGGSRYRVAIHREGYVPFVSDWIKLDGERASVQPIRLRALRNVTGRIEDGQGRAIAGARVVLPVYGAGTSTDTNGRFALGGITPVKTVLVAEHAGFRLRGWVIDPAANAEAGVFRLAQASEAAPVMRPLADPISPEESRALADRLLAPYLKHDPQKDDERSRLAAIASLSEFDPDHALELLRAGEFHEADGAYGRTQGAVAVSLAKRDPARAAELALVQPLTVRSGVLETVAAALPASERDRRRALLEQATDLFKNAGKPANRQAQLTLASRLAEQWMDLGDRDRARFVLALVQAIVDAPSAPPLDFFLPALARAEPDQALQRLQKLPRPSANVGVTIFYDYAAIIAAGIATERLAEAVRVFNLWERAGVQWATHGRAMQMSRRLAQVDPERARGFAASQRGPAERATAWACVAIGLEQKQDNSGAREAIDHAIGEIDRLRESGPGSDPVVVLGTVRLMYPTNPAVLILPVVETVAPDRVADVFWRAVALHPALEKEKRGQLQYSYIGSECILLARYDREVAAALFGPMDDYLQSLATGDGPGNEFNLVAILAKGCIEPRGAVTLIEALATGEYDRANLAHGAKLRLAEMLGLSSDERWRRLWRSMSGQVPLDD